MATHSAIERIKVWISATFRETACFMIKRTKHLLNNNPNTKMKTTKLLTLGLLIGSFTCAVAEDAGPPPPPPGKPPHRPVPPEVLKKFDKDGDGKLSETERAAMKAEREKEMLAKYDADKDGKLSDEERAKAKEDRHKEMIARFDKDGDGKLSETERAAMKAERAERKGPEKE